MPSLQDLLNARKTLKETEITKTLESGEVVREVKSHDGSYIVKDNNNPDSIRGTTISNRRRKKVDYLKRCGFVVDLQPDLKVAEAFPGLTFGSQDVAADLAILQAHKITHILNVGTGIENHFPTKFEYLKLNILDLPEMNIVNHFDEVFEWIDDALNSSGVVFVHCNAGISRSPTFVIGYMMRKQRIGFAEAFAMCKSKRDIKPNAGFMDQLKNYEHSLGISH